MSPYYEQDGVTLWLGDCRSVLPALDLSAVGVVVTDPPYGQTSLSWDRWQDGWPGAVARAAPATASLWSFGSLRMFMDHAAEFAEHWRLAQDLVWEKHNGSSFHADRFRRVHEQIAHFYGPGVSWESVYHEPVREADTRRRVRRWKHGGGHFGEPSHAGELFVSGETAVLMRSVLDVRSCHKAAVHPTQKPLALLVPLIRYSCAPGLAVLDPFAGSGSTLVAARDEGRPATGIEADEAWCEVAANRLAQRLLPLEEAPC